KVVQIMRLAIHVERGGLRISTEAYSAVLMRNPGEGDSLADEQVSRKQALVTLMSVSTARALAFHKILQPRNEELVALLVVGPIGQHDNAVAIDADAVVRVRQVFGSEPEIKRMAGHHFESEARRDRGRAAAQGIGVELAHERNMAHRVGELLRAEVE